MGNEMLAPLVMETKFDHNSPTYLKLRLLQGEQRELLSQIDCLKERVKYIGSEIAEIVGDNLLAQYLQDHESCVGQIIVNYDFGCIYLLDHDLQLRCINEEITNGDEVL